MLMFCEQDASKYQNTKTGNKAFESMMHFKYLGTTLSKQCIQEIKSRLNSGIACYYLDRIFHLPIYYPKTKI